MSINVSFVKHVLAQAREKGGAFARGFRSGNPREVKHRPLQKPTYGLKSALSQNTFVLCREAFQGEL